MQGVWNFRIHIYSKVTGTAKRLHKLYFIHKLEAIILKNLAAQTIKLFMMGVTKHITQYRTAGHVKKTVPEISQWYTNLI